MNKIAERYDITLDYENKFTYDVKGCKECNHTGYLERIAVFEISNL